ncbi:hypothetical protein Caci_9034 [Catenulispora acidiphila DSM 44928]|uniref:Uncharacterized protein n=1 Tax=Catenulispora acidiphila (strain DSM 44928 / JCM 14897 / NBRC 102108 / NRRL B-24433 / ID139908) TaxID=479433 RepID=C7Q5N6_CATAD|nr:hypothetical protein [Catenulispora acidiphila]ACU77847.1 hypothetical protein Caci_9034 [Catenulispora acidiphila DSM 44928]
MRNRAATLTGAVAVIAILAGVLWYANRPAPSPAKAGDCITAPSGGSFKTVGCTDHGAAFKVAAVLATGDSNGCDAYPAVVMSVVDENHTKTLCLDSAK